MDSPTRPSPGRSLGMFSRMSHIWDLSFYIANDVSVDLLDNVWANVIKIATKNAEVFDNANPSVDIFVRNQTADLYYGFEARVSFYRKNNELKKL